MYKKLIFQNVKQSLKDYLIYIITITICVTLFYAFLSISSSYYNPNIGSEYDFTLLAGGMKLSVILVTLLILFLIKYVNKYIFLRKQKEIAIQAVMGMEKKTISLLFFVENFIIGMFSVIIGIFLGMIFSQFITAMLLSDYGSSYKFSWMLFPDTVLLTIIFFSISFIVIGLANIRTINKVKIIDMLYAENKNEKNIKNSYFMPIVITIYSIMNIFMAIVGIRKLYFYSDPRFPIPVQIIFIGNIIIPMFIIIFSILYLFKRKKSNFFKVTLVYSILAIINTVFSVLTPRLQTNYMISLGNGTINQYLLFVIVDLVFIICCIIHLVSSYLLYWKDKSLKNKYTGLNLFFLGQITSKLNTNTKTMSLICITLTASIILFIIAPTLTEWSVGYLKVRSLYDIQISSKYNDLYNDIDIENEDYKIVSDFLEKENIKTDYDLTYNLYLPNKKDFHKRVKFDFPIVAISLSDYNYIRKMLNLDTIDLKEYEFTTHWQSIATEDELDNFLSSNKIINTDSGELTLSKNSYHLEPIGETIYNSYTNILLVFPDDKCSSLMPVIKNRYIQTKETLPFDTVLELQNQFDNKYPESGDGMHYFIRTSTAQINSNKASNFIFKTSMIYGAIILFVICLTILSLQQLMDTPKQKYRFGVLRKIGVDEDNINRLITKQLSFWFGLPVLLAIIIASIVIIYFLQMISIQIKAYIGIASLLEQILIIISILFTLLICYLITTWTMFKRSTL